MSDGSLLGSRPIRASATCVGRGDPSSPRTPATAGRSGSGTYLLGAVPERFPAGRTARLSDVDGSGGLSSALVLRPGAVATPRPAWAPTVGCTSGAGPGTTWRRSVRPSPGGGPWDTRSHWMPNRSPSEPSRFGPVEASPTDEAAARSAPRVAAGRTWPARRRRPPGRGRRRRAPSGSRPPDARSTSLFSHAPITPLHRKVLPYRRTRLTSCIHHSFRTAPPVPSARPGRLRRTH